MNTLKITDRRRLLTERHNLEAAGIWEMEIQGQKRRLYAPCNLNIVIGRRCNCHCGFCFFQGKPCEKPIDDETYLMGLETVLKELKGFPVEITITGGEPTLYPKRLISVMGMVKKYGFSNRTFSTNGTGLLERIDGKPLLQYMKEAGCIYNISLSRMAADDAENRRIFRGDTIGSREIQRIAAFAEVNDMDFRLSCNLLKGAVDSWTEVRRYMEFFGGCGITSFLFREVIPPKKSADVSIAAVRGKERRLDSEVFDGEDDNVLNAAMPAVSDGNREHAFDPAADVENKKYISVSDIVTEMKREREIELLKTAHGMVYDVDIYGWQEKLIKHYKGKPYAPEKKGAGPGEKDLITSLIYEEGGLRTAW